MTALAAGLGAVAGLIAGWFLPVVVYRFSVPADEPLRNSCGVCGRELPWLWARHRCPRCGAAWGPPPWATSVLAGVASGIGAYAAAPAAAVPLFVAFAVYAVLLGAIDIACKRLPHDLVVPATAISLGLFAVIAAATHEWGTLLRAVSGAVALGGVYLMLFLVARGGFGFGDVKLAVLLGLFLGWLSWRAVILGLLLGPLLNAPVVIGLLLARRVDRRGSVPYGPAMLTGALVSIGMSGLINFIGWT